MGKNKGLIEDLKQGVEDLERPVKTGMFDFIKAGKVRCVIIYEDGSFSEFYKKFSTSYTIEIKGRKYFVNPKCFLKGKRTTMIWFFNNPMPLSLDYQPSKLKAIDLMSKEKVGRLSDEQKQIYAKVSIDSEGLNSLFNTRLMKGLYDEGGWLTGKMILIFVIVGIILMLVVLQLTGVVDIMAFFNKPVG